MTYVPEYCNGCYEKLLEPKGQHLCAECEVKALRPVKWFEESGEAYDACQCNATVKAGQALVVFSEKVVGLAWAWPIAVTVEAGKFHEPVAGDPSELLRDANISRAQVRLAVALAEVNGWPVRTEFLGY